MDNWDDLASFANIRYTPAWYYKHFPGFYNVECYKILSNWTQGIRVPDDDDMVAMSTEPDTDTNTRMSIMEEGVEEMKESEPENKKPRYETEHFDLEL